jgi:hypothetical protein
MILEPFGDLPLISFRKALDGSFDFKHGIHSRKIRDSGRFVLFDFLSPLPGRWITQSRWFSVMTPAARDQRDDRGPCPDL